MVQTVSGWGAAFAESCCFDWNGALLHSIVHKPHRQSSRALSRTTPLPSLLPPSTPRLFARAYQTVPHGVGAEVLHLLARGGQEDQERHRECLVVWIAMPEGGVHL